MSKPLAGIKVVEIGQEIQGPFAGLFLSDMGADVVKVENRETGDLSRWATNALIGGPDARNPEISPYFLAMNRGKRGITLDLKKPHAIEIVRRMAKNYDVLLTNYRPGVLDRLGLGFEDLLKLNPKLIYGQASSWGPKGPWVMRPSRDTLAQAASGVMIKTGTLDHPPLPAADVRGGPLRRAQPRQRHHHRAVRARAHRQGPAGRRLDLWHAARDAGVGAQLHFADREGAGARQSMPSFPARGVGRVCHQGRLYLPGGMRRQALAVILQGDGHRTSRNQPRLGDNPTRNFHGAKMEEVLDQIFPRKTTQEWLDLLHGIDVLATEVATIPQILQSEQARANGYLMELDHPTAGKIMVHRSADLAQRRNRDQGQAGARIRPA